VPVPTLADTEVKPSSTDARRISRELASRIGRHKYRMWFGHTVLEVNDAVIEIATDSPSVAKWIDANYSKEIEGIARQTLGRDTHVEVRVRPELFDGSRNADADGNPTGGPAAHGRTDDADDAVSAPIGRGGRRANGVRMPAPPPPAGAIGRRQLRRGPTLRSLGEFVVGPSNRLAYSTAIRLIDDPDAAAVSPLFVHGECGLGKTHLLQGICRRYAETTGRRDHVRYVTGEQFTNEYIASIRANNVDDFRRRIRKLDLLAIDDVHFLSNKVRTQSEFLCTLDEIGLTGSRIVLASDGHPRVIKRFNQALVSRFLSGMVVQIGRPDRQTRVEIVRRLAAGRHLPMSDTAIDAVASHCVGSVRELEGAITKLTALWSLSAEPAMPEPDVSARNGATNGTRTNGATREVGLVLVEQLFREHGWQPPTPVRITTVIDVVCERVGVTRSDLMGSSRHRRVVLGRALVAFLGRLLTTQSYPEIARALGRSYHSTVHTAERRLKRQLSDNQVVEPGEGQKPISVQELVDQLRHEVMRVTSRA